jgi:hypothetical protein
MAVKSSGALSFATDIVGEFADSAPHSLSEFYGGGDKVPAGANPGIATSGQINFNSFYDSVAATVLTISSNTNDYNIGAAAIAAGGDKSTPVILTINSGVTVGSTASTTPAMKTDTGWSSGTTITITNNGSIVGASGSNSSSTGAGGNGGAGGYPPSCGSQPTGAGSAGSSGGSASSTNNGGNAFEHSQTADNNLSVTFSTAGTRTAGSAGTHAATGGGGGGGGGAPHVYEGTYYGGGGGGGGAGNGGGSGGAAGKSHHWEYGCTWSAPSAGSPGGSTSGGSGGPSSWNTNNKGGNGGNLNSNGGTPSEGASGGSAGANGNFSGSTGSALSGNTGQIS